MIEFTDALRRWLTMNNIPLEGVKIVLEFTDARSAHEAQMTIKRDMESPLLPSFGEVRTCNGFPLSLRVTGA
jgi:hypothetical protein